ncbi:outer membrane lipid asymmetry maintenance protein MlaD [Cobetia sp. ICG0124]|uniref:outer membrane lipid asymmetry maintenance protein MlaD n=1 Tax=Cobetia sp. ICG0124 TaxID=2053669 RepID=UPI000FDA385B|nr:outer membrane lipid asymmetry maintenance protein MlaD [Cobetia sp. ICG0124]
MKRTRMVEFGVGLFVLAGFLGMVFLGLRVSGVTFQQADDTFVLNANFSGIGSLKPRSKVTMAGVAIGSVEKIELDPKWFDARVTMKLDSSLKGKLSKDTTAAILTSRSAARCTFSRSKSDDPYPQAADSSTERIEPVCHDGDEPAGLCRFPGAGRAAA